MEYTEYTKEQQEQIMEETALLQATFVENILRVADKIDVDRDGLLIHVTNALGIAARVGSYQDYKLPPVADVEPVKHGRWENIGGDEWCCNCCGYVKTTESRNDRPTYKFCPECGARMDGDKI